MPMDPTASGPVEAYILKAQVTAVVPVGDRSKLAEFHQQFRAAAAGIELPTAGTIDIGKIKGFPGAGGKGGISIS